MAERFLRRLQTATNAAAIKPLEFSKPVDELLSAIFFGGAPKQFAPGRECRMQDIGDKSSIVRWAGFDLSDASIRNHVANGMRLTHLAVEYDNIMSFVLNEDGVISKLSSAWMMTMKIIWSRWPGLMPNSHW
jgi:recombination associated protein RdgC